MKVFLMIYAFPPEITGSGHLYYELARDLTDRGHKVTVLAPLPRQRMGVLKDRILAGYGRKWWLRERMDGFTVVRSKVLPVPLHLPPMKGVDHLAVAFSEWVGGLLAHARPDVILAYSPPLPLGLSAHYLARRYKVPFVFNVQDIFPQYAVDSGVLANPLLIHLFLRMEKYLYTKADIIIVHSEGNRKYLASHRSVPYDKLRVVYNWADTQNIKPGPKYNEFREELGLGDAFVVSYAGTMGWAQNLDTVLQSAVLLKNYKDIVFLLVGDGPKRSELERNAQKLGLSNVRFLPLQPKGKYAQLLRASDVCLISLNKGLTTPVVPGKLMDIMAAGRPVVGCVPLAGDAPRIVTDAQCGFCVDSKDAKGMAEAILTLYHQEELAERFGRNGRCFAESQFSRQVCTQRYQKILMEAIERRS